MAGDIGDRINALSGAMKKIGPMILVLIERSRKTTISFRDCVFGQRIILHGVTVLIVARLLRESLPILSHR